MLALFRFLYLDLPGSSFGYGGGHYYVVRWTTVVRHVRPGTRRYMFTIDFNV